MARDSVVKDKYPELSASRPSVCISSLVLSGNGLMDDLVDTWLSPQNCPISLGNLTSLSFSEWYVSDFQKHLPILAAVSSTLESFEFNPPDEHISLMIDDNSAKFTLIKLADTLPQLKRLNIVIEEDCGSKESYFPWLLAQLSIASASGNKLEFLCIRFIFEESWANFEGEVMKNKWERLDDLLAESKFD
ncbi:hypothetical protein AX16_010201 [Volvariella volvacea WC 439]|nr:hypothetical protein AX16_010201 [Volvariella volvacea WC 439]